MVQVEVAVEGRGGAAEGMDAVAIPNREPRALCDPVRRGRPLGGSDHCFSPARTVA